MQKKLIVTIDGPAGSGKSTIARLTAERLGAVFLDTGAMYRAVTLAAVKRDVQLEDADAVLALIGDTTFEFKAEKDRMSAAIDGEDVTMQIRDPQLTGKVKYIANAAKIREKLVEMQRRFAEQYSAVVTEGRDQGTVVFPDARVKIFLNADTHERARRRYLELKERGVEAELEKIESDIQIRDLSDESREVGPLKCAADARVIDTTNMSIGEVVDTVIELVEKNG